MGEDLTATGGAMDAGNDKRRETTLFLEVKSEGVPLPAHLRGMHVDV